MTNKEIVRELLASQQKYDRFYDRLTDIGIDINNAFSIDLLGLCLDLLGVPKDNSTTVDSESPDYFCRDYFIDIWFDIENEPDAIERYIRGVSKDVKKLQSKRNS